MAAYREQGEVFTCEGSRLVGISALPEDASSTGVLILVGGPQYRVGSHRQFTQLARGLAEQGVASLRFDYRGMGDSEGDRREFHDVESDIRAATACLMRAEPRIERVVLWGLCDAASAALMYAPGMDSVSAVVALNPWVHAGEYSPEVKLSHYYAPLLRGRETWRRFFTGKIDVVPAIREFAGDSAMLARKAIGKSLGVPLMHPFVEGMLRGLERFDGRCLFILSEQDLTAQEFLSLAENDKRWKKQMARESVRCRQIDGADHTFSRPQWEREVLEATLAVASAAPED
jgi:exosortase A-associated hydrolase 1